MATLLCKILIVSFRVSVCDICKDIEDIEDTVGIEVDQLSCFRSAISRVHHFIVLICSQY